MKKIALFALAALCVTAVKAATLSWTASLGWTNFTSTNMGVILYNGDISAAKTFVNEAYPQYSGDGRISDIIDRDGGSWVPEGGVKSYIGSNANDWTWGLQTTPAATSGTLTVFGSNYSDDHMKAWGNVATIIFFDGTTTNAHYYELTDEQVASLKDGNDVTIVPEPTALALLALGVAGLALKRKHA